MYKDKLEILLSPYNFIIIVHVCGVCESIHVGIRGQLSGSGSLLPPWVPGVKQVVQACTENSHAYWAISPAPQFFKS